MSSPSENNKVQSNMMEFFMYLGQAKVLVLNFNIDKKFLSRFFTLPLNSDF